MTMLSDGMLMGEGRRNVEFVSGSQENYTTSDTVVDVDAPSGMVAGDIVICVLWIINVGVSRSISARPSGFSSVVSRSNSDGFNAFIEVKVATGSEPATYTWTLNGSVSTRRASVVVYRNASTVDTAGSFSTPGSGTSVSASGITAAQEGALLAIYLAQAGASTVTAGPAGMVSRSPQPPAIAIYDLIPSPSGATGSKSATWSTSTTLMGVLLQIA